MASSMGASGVTANQPVVRRTANYHPNVWGDTFLLYTADEPTLTRWKEKAEVLRREVREMFKNCSTFKLSLIDAIQRLGVSYHFEEEIEQELDQVYAHFRDQSHDHDDSFQDDLNVVSLRFRLLREHGYNAKCDVFKKFMDAKGNFKESIKEDVNGILSLYEAAQLKFHGEGILDLSLSFATASLKSLLPRLSPVDTERVLHALHHPIRKGLPRLDSVFYFSVYNRTEQTNQTLLEFAKLDFNILQKLHQQELSNLSKWWKELDFTSKLPFARDRLVECYFWVLGVYFEPKYAQARSFFTQMISMGSVADDIYDAYGTKEELHLFTKAIKRWDESSINGLPEYMKIYYRALLDVFRNMEKELVRQGRPTYGVQYTKEAMKSVLQAYYEEREWLGREEIPTVREYMDVALVSCAYPLLAISSIVGMGDVVDEEAFKWMIKGPKIVQASAVICRLVDDVVSCEFERQRENSVTAVQCYAREHRVSEEEAGAALMMKVESAWEDVNEGLMRPTPVARALLERILNLCRVIEVLYKNTDGYTHVNATVKGYVISMLRDAQV